MTNYEFGDVLLLNAFPYSHLDGVKKRPALVLADTGDQDLILARITTEECRDAFDVNIVRWKESGLLAPSTARVSKIATLGKRLVLKKLGRLGSPERKKISATLKNLF